MIKGLMFDLLLNCQKIPRATIIMLKSIRYAQYRVIKALDRLCGCAGRLDVFVACGQRIPGFSCRGTINLDISQKVSKSKLFKYLFY